MAERTIRQVNSERDRTEYPNLRFAEGCREDSGTVSVAVLDNRPDAVPLHIKSPRQELPICGKGISG